MEDYREVFLDLSYEVTGMVSDLKDAGFDPMLVSCEEYESAIIASAVDEDTIELDVNSSGYKYDYIKARKILEDIINF